MKISLNEEAAKAVNAHAKKKELSKDDAASDLVKRGYSRLAALAKHNGKSRPKTGKPKGKKAKAKKAKPSGGKKSKKRREGQAPEQEVVVEES